jgi:hypothetical protein
MIGLLRLEIPPGLPDVDTQRARQVRHLGLQGMPALSVLAPDERDALFLSLSLIVRNADYHARRFNLVLEAMDRRRAQADAFLTYDFYMVDFASVFEASGALSASRSAIDEIIFIAARVAGVSAPDIKEYWKTSTVMSASFAKRPEFDLPAVRTLRNRTAWYEELNDYRNVFRHRGCRSTIGGCFPIGSDFPEASRGEHNVMLFPDRSSLIGNTRAHQWTYNDGVRLEHLVQRGIEGLERLIDDLCRDIWGGPEFLAREWMGRVPKDEHPNLLVAWLQPVFFVTGTNALLPVFRTRECAEAFRRFVDPREDVHPAAAHSWLPELPEVQPESGTATSESESRTEEFISALLGARSPRHRPLCAPSSLPQRQTGTTRHSQREFVVEYTHPGLPTTVALAGQSLSSTQRSREVWQ